MGRSIWYDGEMYQGTWKGDSLQGQGISVSAKKSSMYSGTWEDGWMTGHGVKTWIDTRRYDG
jgi:hypothetical protein